MSPSCTHVTAVGPLERVASGEVLGFSATGEVGLGLFSRVGGGVVTDTFWDVEQPASATNEIKRIVK